MHSPGAAHHLPGKIALRGATAVQHDGAVPPGGRQVVPQLLRRPGHAAAVPGTIEGQTAVLDADGGAAPLPSLPYIICQRIQRSP